MVDPSQVRVVGEALRGDPSVRNVINIEDLVERVLTVTSILRTAGTVVLVIVGVIALFIIINTIRLAVLARAEEIEVMRLVGASDAFIRWPFVFEGAFVGLLGSLLTLAILLAVADPLSAFMADFFRVLPLQFGSLTRDLVALVMGAGVGLGILGSWLSVRTYLIRCQRPVSQAIMRLRYPAPTHGRRRARTTRGLRRPFALRDAVTAGWIDRWSQPIPTPSCPRRHRSTPRQPLSRSAHAAARSRSWPSRSRSSRSWPARRSSCRATRWAARPPPSPARRRSEAEAFQPFWDTYHAISDRYAGGEVDRTPGRPGRHPRDDRARSATRTRPTSPPTNIARACSGSAASSRGSGPRSRRRRRTARRAARRSARPATSSSPSRSRGRRPRRRASCPATSSSRSMARRSTA